MCRFQAVGFDKSPLYNIARVFYDSDVRAIRDIGDAAFLNL